MTLKSLLLLLSESKENMPIMNQKLGNHSGER